VKALCVFDEAVQLCKKVWKYSCGAYAVSETKLFSSRTLSILSVSSVSSISARHYIHHRKPKFAPVKVSFHEVLQKSTYDSNASFLNHISLYNTEQSTFQATCPKSIRLLSPVIAMIQAKIRLLQINTSITPSQHTQSNTATSTKPTSTRSIHSLLYPSSSTCCCHCDDDL